jgi:glutamate carboxypeptidase
MHSLLRQFLPVCAWFLASTAPRAEAAISPKEAEVVRAVDQATPAAFRLLEKSVNLNSGTMNFAGVREVGRLYEPVFADLGFTVRWIDGASWKRAGHLVAERHPEAARLKILLIGHLDTVFEHDSPFQRFEAGPDSTAKGPGVIDMKGGIAVTLLALSALSAADVLDSLAVTVFLTGDEENSGKPNSLSRKELIDAARWADVAIGFEDGDGHPQHAVTSRRGSTVWRLRTWGRPSHSSQIFTPEVGSGAIFEAARILSTFHDSLQGEPYLTFNAGVILGGTIVDHKPAENRGSAFGKSNVVPESTLVDGDLRALTVEQFEKAKDSMRSIVAAHHPRTGAGIRFEDGYPPLAPSTGNSHLLDLYNRASQDLGFGPVTAVDPAKAGAADISFTEGLVEMAIDGIGLRGTGGHTVEETADLRTLPVQAKRVALTLFRLAGSRP